VSDVGKARQARIITGDIFGNHDVTDRVADIRLLLAPLAPEDVRTVRCLGLNYAKHAQEVRIDQKSPVTRDGKADLCRPVCLFPSFPSSS
jgi:2-keto-4-pentenoate hydratase/2-oxohepta-3-ene-1,7-dioic acid hydratase in catechol pathway